MRLILSALFAAGLLVGGPLAAHAAAPHAKPAKAAHHAVKPRTDSQASEVDRLNEMSLQNARGAAAPAPAAPAPAR